MRSPNRQSLATVAGLAVGLMLMLPACEKVPIVDIGASFSLADVSWFQDEETLFIFYRVDAYQGLGPESQLELTYRTDDLEQPWATLADLPPVHLHLPVDCGPYARCGSASIRVAKAPRDVGLRLRYHKDGALTLGAPVVFNVVGSGPPHLARSLVLYGVFDEINLHVQWRARHQFPTLRNQQVEDLGLRRYFRVESPRFGDLSSVDPLNPYSYAFASRCPTELTALGWAVTATTTRAIFSLETVPVPAYESPSLCGESTVLDAKGTFSTAVVAQKNPQTKAAFPSLRSPIKTNTMFGFSLVPCQTSISAPHLAMQKQRTLLESAPENCTDNWQRPGFVTELATRFKTALDATRLQGHDMVMALVLHHADNTGQFTGKVEEALDLILPAERDKSSPRLSGVFVFDSFAHKITRPAVGRLTLWCPAILPGMAPIDDLDLIGAVSARSCPLLPDLPDIVLGPVKLSSLTVLPTRPQFETFVAKYGEGQTGRMLELQFFAPERTPTSDNVPVGDFGVVTFFNNESFAAAPSDAFSYCASEDARTNFIAARLPAFPNSPFPLQALPEVHSASPSPTYQLGLGWDFPYLLRLKYETIVAGAATALSFTVPFGIGTPSETYYGSPLWMSSEVPLGSVLTQCTRFCDAPTFDSAGVYNVQSIFRTTYSQQCYRPVFPVFDAAHAAEGGYPLDP